MAGNLSDHYRVFDTGNNLDVATAFSAILVCSKDGYWPVPVIHIAENHTWCITAYWQHRPLDSCYGV